MELCQAVWSCHFSLKTVKETQRFSRVFEKICQKWWVTPAFKQLLVCTESTIFSWQFPGPAWEERHHFGCLSQKKARRVTVFGDIGHH